MSKKQLPASTVAEHILSLRSGRDTTPLHIVKLVYLCHGWMLGLKNQPLIDEPIVTGRYGPIVQSVFDEYKRFGDGPIVGVKGVDHTADLSDLESSVLTFVHMIYEDYADTELSAMTHEPETPWSEVYHNEGLGVEIPQKMIADHYAKMIVDIRNAEPAPDVRKADADIV